MLQELSMNSWVIRSLWVKGNIYIFFFNFYQIPYMKKVIMDYGQFV